MSGHARDDALRELVRAERSDGRSLVVSAFGADGTGGLAVIGEDRAEVIDHRPGRGLTSIDGTLLRIVRSERDVDPALDSGRLWSLECVAGDDRGVIAGPASDLHEVFPSGDAILVSTGEEGSVLRLPVEGVHIVAREDAPTSIDAETVIQTGGVVRGLAEFGARVVATVSSTDGETPGRLVDVESGEVVIDGLGDPIAAHWSQGRWVISDLATNALEVIDDRGRMSVPLGGLGRGMLVRADRAYVAVGRPPILRHPADRVRYRIVVVDLTAGSVIGEQVLPVARLFTIASIPTAITDGLSTAAF